MGKKVYIGAGDSYTLIEYIQSSGTQYIDTGVVCSSENIKVEMDFEVTSVSSSSSWHTLFGSEGSSYSLTAYINNAAVKVYAGSADKEAEYSIEMNKRYNLIATAKNNTITSIVNGASQSATYSGTMQNGRTIALFANNNSSGVIQHASFKSSFCKIYDNDVIVRDYISVLDKNGVACLYDKVSGGFYYNAGTGSFTAGATTGDVVTTEGKAREVKKIYVGIENFVPVVLPSGYTQVEYLQSTGTQYVDTGKPLTINGYFEIDFQFTELIGSDKDWVLGTYNSSSAGMLVGDNGQGGVVSIWSRGAGMQRTPIPITQRCKLSYNIATGEVVLNGATIKISAFDPGALNALLFSRSYNDTPCKAKIYRYRYIESNKLVIDYVPCVNSNGIAGFYDLVRNEFYSSLGADELVAGTSLVYGVARKIRKGYIGIGGVARPFIGNKLEYYGVITPLSAVRGNLAATTVGNYALFAGGHNTNNASSPFATVDVYDRTLTKSTATNLNSARSNLSATTIGDYALFAGGLKGTGTPYYSTVDAYNTTLTRSSPTSLSSTRNKLSATTIGNYALFAGGYGYSVGNYKYFFTVDAYNTILTRSNPTSLSTAVAASAATTVGGYALFGGGAATGDVAQTMVNAYDASLTRSIPTALSAARFALSAATVGNYALFGGGMNGSSTNTATADAYDENLTRLALANLSVARNAYAATSIGGYALFGYGDSVDIYDEELTKTRLNSGSGARWTLAATTIGDYALFGGGSNFDTVDAYVLD